MAGADPVDDQPARSKQRTVTALLKEIAFVVVGALVVSSLLRAFVGQMFVIPSGSMENTLLIDDRVVVQKVSDFLRGDVVVFTDPANWLPDEPDHVGPLDRCSSSSGCRRWGPGTSSSGSSACPGDTVVF